MVRNSFSSLMSPTTPPRRMLTTPVLTGDSGRAECATEKTFIDTNQHLISQGHANIILPTWRKVSQSVSAFMRCVMSRSMDVPTASNHYICVNYAAGTGSVFSQGLYVRNHCLTKKFQLSLCSRSKEIKEKV